MTARISKQQLISVGNRDALLKAAHIVIRSGDTNILANIAAHVGLREEHYITAIQTNRLNVFVWMYDKKYPLTRNIILQIVSAGLNPFIRSLHRMGFSFKDMFVDSTINIIDTALLSNKFDTAGLLFEIKAAGLSEYTLNYVVNTGHIRSIIYFAVAGGVLNEGLYTIPIMKAWDHVIKYLLDIGCPFSDNTIKLAEKVFAEGKLVRSKIILLMFGGCCPNCALNALTHSRKYLCVERIMYYEKDEAIEKIFIDDIDESVTEAQCNGIIDY
jgi:hypothetical protein